MILFAATVFAGAFLLFLVQPVIAKQILPWFGGSAAVWTTCMVFFQALLLAGYAYADLVARKLSPRAQAFLHGGLLALSLASLPIVAADSWKPLADSQPALRILLLLGATIGLPYFLLATTGPLVQAWFSRSFPAGTVYRLFALSNLASLAGLVAYPPLIEPNFTLRHQAVAWSALYVVFAALCGTLAWRSSALNFASGNPSLEEGRGPTLKAHLFWLALSALGSLMLLAVTNHITQNIASVPFLWILPLVLYLLSFILVFDVGGARSRSGWYSRTALLPLLFLLLAGMAYGLAEDYGAFKLKVAIPLYAGGLFVVCMFCHGELAAMRPAPRYLTRFYLMIAAGGALGGMFVGLIAPYVFDTYLELPIGMLACALLALLLAWRPLRPASWAQLAPAAAAAVAAVVAYYDYQYLDWVRANTIVQSRNFYGTLRVKQYGETQDPDSTRTLIHGVINHGAEFTAPARRLEPISYFGPKSGIALALDFYAGRPRRVGVVGLGAGVFLAYGRKGDSFRVYELDPEVVKIARESFWYLTGTPARVDVVVGDGRLSLERDPPQGFDLISVDAFSSDAIPMHLITREALRAYRRHLAPGGVIVFNATNRYVRLPPVIRLIAGAEGMKAINVSDWGDDAYFSGTEYVLVTDNAALLADPRFSGAEPIKPVPGLRPWTDDFNNLFRALK